MMRILHCPGQGQERHLGYLFSKTFHQFKKADNITIITIVTSDRVETSPLLRQLLNNNNPFINAADFIEQEKKWQKNDKIYLYQKALNQVETEYTILLDANDVIILNDLDEDFINEWKEFNCDILFNGSEYLYPKDSHILTIESEYPFFCQHYLNCGVCFGRTEEIRKLYDKAAEIANEKHDSEQYWIREAIREGKFRKVKIDNRSKLFLLSHGN